MALAITHPKVDTIADWTQADLDAQIALGNFPPGTLLADIVLASDWNDDHSISGTLAASDVSVAAGQYLPAATAQETIAQIVQNLRGSVVIDMNNDDFTITDSDAECGIFLITNAGDGTKTLTVPTTSDDFTTSTISLITAYAGNSFYITSQTGGAGFPINVTAPEADLIIFRAGGLGASLYNGFVDNAAFGAGWNGSLKAPTQNSVYDAITPITTKTDFITVTQAVDLDTIESDTATNNAKVTNATHTGDATGSGALTVEKIQGKAFPALGAGDDQKYPKYVHGSNAFVMTAIAASGDMVLADAQTNSGVKTFLTGTLGLRNVANTFTSFFSNAATAARTWTLKDADGTLAFTTDITGTNSGTNTGDQTSIVGITGTKAQFDTAVTDGNIVYVGDTVGLATTVTTNANLTGQVTSVGNAATLDKTAISGQGVVAVAGGDLILFGDISNANALARCTAQDIANLAAGGGLTLGKAVAITSQYMALQ